MRKILKKSLLSAMVIASGCMAYGQSDTIRYDISATGVFSTGKYSPFWLQNNRYGKIASGPQSANLMAGIYKDYTNQRSLLRYGFGSSILLQTDRNTRLYFHELYAKAQLLVFDLAVGKREEHYGNQDSTLSCGGFLFSTNAQPMPKITAGIERFTAIPFTHGYLEIKGGLSHGWFTDNIYSKGLLLHHKYVYGRIGGNLPVQFQFGLDHVAQWGGSTPDLGQQPEGIQYYKNIFLGRSGGSGGEAINTLGNHIISQSTRLDVKVSDFRIAAYWQNISEDKPIRFIAKAINLPDGLWGLSVRNKRFPIVKGILYEYLNTTDQSGPYHDKDGIIYGGADGYFRNYVYYNGWTYFSRTIGTPLISSPLYNSDGSVLVTNNRVQVHHIGLEGDIGGWNYRTMASMSKNYGTYWGEYYKRNTALLVEASKQFPKLAGMEIGWAVSSDIGNQFGNSVGIQLQLRKRGDLFKF